jgi:hypothetical protein
MAAAEAAEAAEATALQLRLAQLQPVNVAVTQVLKFCSQNSLAVFPAKKELQAEMLMMSYNTRYCPKPGCCQQPLL